MTLQQLLAKSALAAGVGLAAIGLGYGRGGRPAHAYSTATGYDDSDSAAGATGTGGPGSAAAAANSADPTNSADPASRSGSIGTTRAPSLALSQRRGVCVPAVAACSPYGWKLVPSRFHSTRPAGSTPRATRSRLRILLVAVVGRSSASQT